LPRYVFFTRDALESESLKSKESDEDLLDFCLPRYVFFTGDALESESLKSKESDEDLLDDLVRRKVLSSMSDSARFVRFLDRFAAFKTFTRYEFNLLFVVAMNSYFPEESS
jgi:hypothetical protein